MDRYVRLNRELWDEWTVINYRSEFYDVAGFIANPSPLDEIVRAGLGELAGKSVLHLQCHFGMDTLRIGKEAAQVTGVDFSPKAIKYALALSERVGIAATLIEADVYELEAKLTGEFDILFTSYGVLGWLPDLGRGPRSWPDSSAVAGISSSPTPIRSSGFSTTTPPSSRFAIRISRSQSRSSFLPRVMPIRRPRSPIASTSLPMVSRKSSRRSEGRASRSTSSGSARTWSGRRFPS